MLLEPGVVFSIKKILLNFSSFQHFMFLLWVPLLIRVFLLHLTRRTTTFSYRDYTFGLAGRIICYRGMYIALCLTTRITVCLTGLPCLSNIGLPSSSYFCSRNGIFIAIILHFSIFIYLESLSTRSVIILRPIASIAVLPELDPPAVTTFGN